METIEQSKEKPTFQQLVDKINSEQDLFLGDYCSKNDLNDIYVEIKISEIQDGYMRL